jgi:hypothetical protein
MKHFTAPALATAAALMAGPALAQSFPSLSFSGYGTAGAVHSNEDRADYLVDAFKPNGPGYTDDVSLKVDTRLGGQVTANVTSRLSGVVQVLVQQNYDNTWRPRIEWANLKYQVTDDLSVRAGRVVLPVFMVTDSRRIGYANVWVRPPVEVYSLVPVTNNDGVDATWRLPLGDWTNTMQLTAGRSDSRFPDASGFDAGQAEARKIVALVNTLEKGPFTARVSYGEARLTIAAYRPLFDAFRLFGPPGEAIAERYHADKRRVTFFGLGANYDPGAWFATGEFARFDTNSIVGNKSAWYVGSGMRVGKFTPYATFARIKSESPSSDPGVSTAGLPPEVAALGQLANFTLNRSLDSVPEQSTASLGVRWDFLRNAAFKFQFDRVRVGSRSHGTFGNVQPDFPAGAKVNVVSAAIDFVF